jgi:hypothetical protein
MYMYIYVYICMNTHIYVYVCWHFLIRNELLFQKYLPFGDNEIRFLNIFVHMNMMI